MSNMIYTHPEPTLDNVKLKTHPDGTLLGLTVKRPPYSTYYHRTSRSADDFFNSKNGILKPIFPGTTSFKHYAKEKRILDLGCGGGTLVHDLRRESVNIFGFDIYLTDDQKAAPYFIQGDAFQAPLRDETFNCILSSWSVFTYEPIFQFGQLMKEARRLLAPSGEMILAGVESHESILQIQTLCTRLGMRLQYYSKSSIIRCVRQK